MTTALDIIRLSLEASGRLGVGQTPLAEDSTRGLRLLNMMLSSWRVRRWMVFHLVDTAFQCTGAESYSVGLGGDFNILRPDRLETAFARQLTNASPNQIDYPLQELKSREDYSQIALKQLASFPSYFFYDSGFPLGAVYPWPLPSNQFELHIVTKSALQQFANLNDNVVLPPEYEEALWSNLTLRMCPIYQIEATPETIAVAKASLAAVVGANTQIPRLSMPSSLSGGWNYNIYSDQSYGL